MMWGGGTYLRHLWEETDGERQSQAEGGEAHQSVDGQDEPPLPLQQRESGGRSTHVVVHLTAHVGTHVVVVVTPGGTFTNMHQCRAFSMKRQISERLLQVIIRTEIFLEELIIAVNYRLFVVSI